MRFAVSQLIFGRISIFSCANDVIEGGKKGPLLFYFIFFFKKLNVFLIFFLRLTSFYVFFFLKKKKLHLPV